MMISIIYDFYNRVLLFLYFFLSEFTQPSLRSEQMGMFHCSKPGLFVWQYTSQLGSNAVSEEGC